MIKTLIKIGVPVFIKLSRPYQQQKIEQQNKKGSGRQDEELFVRQDLHVINDPEGFEKIPSKARAITKAKVERVVKRSDTKKPEPQSSGRARKPSHKIAG